ncbi:hypothetical protein PybrP1_002056 [[Pythium] brassicae (nom. inval.)]|nr:hypothetical protein PybrP1_002056 [[Pythium] brassicae (nom. inval.)]
MRALLLAPALSLVLLVAATSIVAAASVPAAEESLNSDDSVRAYCVESGDARAVDRDDYIDTQRTGFRAAGALTFGPMVNMRCAWQFRFVTEGGDVLAVSPLVRLAKGDDEPLQIHLAATGTPTEMRVTWTSGAAATAGRAVVQYGASRAALTRSAPAAAATYATKDMCAAPATTESPRWFRDPGHIFTGVMTNLTPNATYFYRVGDSTSGSLSDVKQFVVPPAPGASATTPMSFVVFGDLAKPTSATGEFRVPGGCGTTMALIERDIVNSTRAYVAVFHIGDLSYARGVTYLWDQFGLLIEGVASRVAYMIGVGNHDYGYLEGKFIDEARFPPNPLLEEDGTSGFDSGGECGVPMTTRFAMPANGNGPFWYSTEMGLTHHAVISGEHDVRAGSPMHAWLVDDLRRVNRTRTPWLFVHIHRPLYCSETYEDDYRLSLLLRNHLEALLNEYRVDVVFSGHYHAYERTCPVYDEQCFHGEQPDVALAPVHIMVGSGGAKVDTEGYYGRDWSLAALREFGYGRVHVHNASHLQFEFVANALAGVKDAAWIVSNHSWPNVRVRADRVAVVSSREMVFVGLGALLMLTLLFFMSRADKRQQQETACFIREGAAVAGSGKKGKDAAASQEHEVQGLLLSEIVTAT